MGKHLGYVGRVGGNRGGWRWMVVGARFDNARLKCVQIFLITYIEFIHKNNSDYHGIGKM